MYELMKINQTKIMHCLVFGPAFRSFYSLKLIVSCPVLKSKIGVEKRFCILNKEFIIGNGVL